MATPPPEDLYATFAGSIDRSAIAGFTLVLSGIANGRIRHLHLLMQSDGGNIDDGIFLHGYLRGLPFPITAYNTGTIGSIAVLAYVGCGHRCMSGVATLMMHPVYRLTQNPIDLAYLKQTRESIDRDEKRIESIFNTVPLPLPIMRARRIRTVVLTASECIQAGLAHEVKDWSVPQGAQTVAIPWQQVR